MKAQQGAEKGVMVAMRDENGWRRGGERASAVALARLNSDEPGQPFLQHLIETARFWPMRALLDAHDASSIASRQAPTQSAKIDSRRDRQAFFSTL